MHGGDRRVMELLSASHKEEEILFLIYIEETGAQFAWYSLTGERQTIRSNSENV